MYLWKSAYEFTRHKLNLRDDRLRHGKGPGLSTCECIQVEMEH